MPWEPEYRRGKSCCYLGCTVTRGFWAEERRKEWGTEWQSFFGDENKWQRLRFPSLPLPLTLNGRHLLSESARSLCSLSPFSCPPAPKPSPFHWSTKRLSPLIRIGAASLFLLPSLLFIFVLFVRLGVHTAGHFVSSPSSRAPGAHGNIASGQRLLRGPGEGAPLTRSFGLQGRKTC